MAVQNLDWNGVVNLIANYYQTSAPEIERVLTQNGVKVGDVTQAFKMLEGSPYEVFYNADGTVRTYSYGNVGTVMDNGTLASQAINSNTPVTKTQVKIPLTTTATEPVTTASPVTFKSGMAQAGNFVFGSLLPAVAAANVGITLGKTIDGALYSVNPDFFDSIGWGSLNPETWNSITADMGDSMATRVFNTVFKLDPNTGKAQTYLDERAFAYLTKILYDKDFFASSSGVDTSSVSDITFTNVPDVIPLAVNSFDRYHYNTVSSAISTRYTISATQGDFVATSFTWFQSRNQFLTIVCSKNPFTIYDSVSNTSTNVTFNRTVKGKTIYYWEVQSNYRESDNVIAVMIPDAISPVSGAPTSDTDGKYGIAYAMLYGTAIQALDGVGTQTGATTPQLDPNDDLATILSKLQAQFSDLWDDAVTQTVVQPDGTIREYTYIPVSQSDVNPNPTEGYDPSSQPISGNSSQADPSFDPANQVQDMIDYMLEIITRIPDYTDETTGEGSTTPVVVPVGSASALYTVYNPTESEIHSFGSWLWSSNFVDQLLKMFNDPMQAIISLHKVFCSPTVSGRNNIVVGYLDSGVSANVVTAQYVDIDCGSVQLPEEFQNVFDYNPFTEVSIYLPFIGFCRLDVNDIMRGTISVKYHVDVLTGACLSEVVVIRDGVGGTLYQYSGDCSVHYPLSSGSYMGIVGALLGVAGTVASGGALAPMALGVASGVMGARSSVERSGSLSGNAGAMGIKKPYLVIQKPQTNTPADFNKFTGIPSNEIVKISECTGFISCSEVHAVNTICTDSEMNELLTLLKSGILI